MRIKEQYFAAFDKLLETGIKIREVNIVQVRALLPEVTVTPALFYQYRHLYKKERGLCA